MAKNTDEHIKTDVLIIGGGLAGVNAAIGAAEKGARVLVVDKGSLERSGNIGGGVDHFMAYLESGEQWDTRDAYLEYVSNMAKGAVNIKVQEAVFCDELTSAINRYARIRNPLTQPDGNYYRTKSMGQPGPYWINFNGKNLKPRLAAEARRLGVKAIAKVAITDLMVEQGNITGAVGFNIKSGEFLVISAPSTILATGNTNRLYGNITGMGFNTWLCPANTGGAQCMAFRAGATLANMEYTRFTVVPMGFSAPGLNAFTGMGCIFINSSGEQFMYRYHPLGNKAPRYKLAEGVMTEILAGRGPVQVDCRHLTGKEMAHLKSTLGYDKDTLPDFVEQKQIDLALEPLEVMLSEGMQAGPSEVCGSGIMIDEKCRASTPGLYAAGDCADQMRCVHISTTGGYLAGKQAALYALNLKSTNKPTAKNISLFKERVYIPLERKQGTPADELEKEIRKTMAKHAGPIKNAGGLSSGLYRLNELKRLAADLKADNYHELMRVHEAEELLQVGEITMKAASFREESRFGIFHNRSDYPETDNQKWLGQVLISNKDSNVVATFKPLND